MLTNIKKHATITLSINNIEDKPMRIYTDASTRGGISGIAYVVTDARDVELFKEGVVIAQRDNNTAELSAVLFALERVQYIDSKHITIFTDSWYVINAVRNGVRRENEIGLVNKNV